MFDRLTTLHREQKVAMAFLAIFVVGAAVVTLYSFSVRINRPFLLQQAKTISALSSFQSSANATGAAANLTDDTDGDGLTDADEVNIYHTSPYLSDSDSDGIPDGQEVANHTDPNCPQGKTCAAPVATPTVNNPIVSSLAPEPTPPAITPEIANMLQQLHTPSDIRSFLLQAGVSQTNLDSLSDDQVTALFQQTLQQLGVNSSVSGQTAPAPTATTPATTPVTASAPAPSGATLITAVQGLKNPSEIRKFLLQSGVPQATLDQINDDDLVKTFQETLTQVGAAAPQH